MKRAEKSGGFEFEGARKSIRELIATESSLGGVQEDVDSLRFALSI